MSSILPKGKTQFTNLLGRPLVGGSVYFYAPGTENKKDTWQDEALTIPNTNPVLLDARGEATIWGDGEYRQVVKDLLGITIWDQVVSASISSVALSGPGGAAMVGMPFGGTLADQFSLGINRVVDSIAALRALNHTVFQRAFVAGYYAPHDGGGGAYQYDSNDTSSVDNGGTIIVASDGARWKLQVTNGVTVKQFGAKGDGTTDDYNAFSKGLLAVRKLTVPYAASGYYLSQGLVVSDGHDLSGEVFYPGNDTKSTKLIFANGVSICLAIDGVKSSDSVGGGTASAHKLAITRQGTPPAGSIGVQVRGAYNSILEDIFSVNHQICMSLLGAGGSGNASLSNGIACTMSRIYTAIAYDAHWEINSWPELRVTGGRSGMNGLGDVAGNTHVRITSPSGGTGGAGPNTIVFDNFQFNQGQPGPANWLTFTNNLAGVGNQVIFQFNNCHIENITGAYIKSTSTNSYIQKLTISNTVFNQPVPMFDVQSTLEIDAMKFVACNIAATTFNPTVQYLNGMALIGCTFGGTAATLSAPANKNWQVASIGNNWFGGSAIVLSGTGWSSLVFQDTVDFSSTFTNTASPAEKTNVVVPRQSLQSWTPQLTFGGLSTGIAYSIQSGAFQIIGNLCVMQFRVKLSSKGSATGNAEIWNLPVPFNASLYQTGGGGAIVQNNGMAALAGPILAQGAIGQTAGSSQSVIKLLQQQAASTNTVTDANFTNASEISGVIVFFT